MLASVYHRFGPAQVLELQDVEAPRPQSGHALVKVHAAALNPKDVLVRKGKMTWLVGKKMPRIPGYDFAGELLEKVGDLPAGTPVYGMVQSHQGGCCAEIVSVPMGQWSPKPVLLSMTEAAAIPLAALTALQALRDKLKLKPGQRVLLNGASGGVGTLAIQIARALGAEPVATCSQRNLSRVIKLGATEAIDYTSTKVSELRNFDHIFDIFGNLSWSEAKKMLKPGGNYCTTVPKPAALLQEGLSRLGLHRASLVVVKSNQADLEILSRWVSQGQLKAVIDRTLPLQRAVEGHEYIETKRARGKVVLKIYSEE